MTPGQRSQVSISFLLITALAAAIPAAAQCNSNDAGAPCFAGNPDILGGRTSLLRDDDLVFNTVTVDGGTASPAGGNLLTSNSTITQTSETQITASNVNNNALSNAITIEGRLFNVNHDQILSAALVQNPGGQQTGAATLEGIDSSMTVPPLAVFNFGQTLYGTSGNFLGGGFDQMLVAAVNSSGQVYFQVLAAADPASTTSGLVAGPVSAPVATSATLFAVAAGVFTDPQAAEVPRPPAQIALLSASPNTTGGIVVTFYAVDSNLNVSPTGKSLNLTLSQFVSPITVAIAAGRFSGGTHDQLAIAYPIFGSGPLGAPEVTTIDFDAQGNPTQETTTLFPVNIFVPQSATSLILLPFMWPKASSTGLAPRNNWGFRLERTVRWETTHRLES